MSGFVVQRRALPRAEFEALRARVLGSPLVARSTLAGSFQASRGFAITFTRAAVPEVVRRIPQLGPFLSLALRPRSGRRVQPWWRRLSRWEEPNAFYLNVLVVPARAKVGRHTDGTLRGPSGDPAALPQQVSVLYLQVPAGMTGGELALYDGARAAGRLQPVENALVRFRGDLAHEVCEVACDEGALRASVVLEQYRLTGEALARLQPIHLQSNAGFTAYLHDERPPADFTLD